MVQILPESWLAFWNRWEIHVLKLWNEWEIRALVLTSLWLQLMLIGLGKQRKRDRRKRIRYTLWLAYLSADWVATVALGSLSNQQGDDDTVESSNILKALWAPILLLHLGGPDTITAYSMEDNALWLRHLLGLLVQISVALYVFVKSFRLTQLNYVAIPLFVAGIVKYGERTWALRSASSEQFRDSLLPSPDPGPNYAKFMEEYALRETEGYNIQCIKMKEPKVVVQSLVTDSARDCHIEEASTPKRAYEYLQTYKRLFADLILGFQELAMSKSFFLLLIGACALEILGIVAWLLSDWALIWLDHHERMPAKQIYKVISCFKIFSGDSKWSNLMVQYNLISSCLEGEPTRSCTSFPCCLYQKVKLKMKSEWTERIPDWLKEHTFKQLLQHTSDSEEDREFCTYRGAWALERYEAQDLQWSIDKEFDQSILLWHIATDLCCYADEESRPIAEFVC